MVLIHQEIDGTARKIKVTQADEGFLHLPAGSMEACAAKGYHLYRGETGEYYLGDSQGNVAATTLPVISTFIRMLIMK